MPRFISNSLRSSSHLNLNYRMYIIRTLPGKTELNTQLCRSNYPHIKVIIYHSASAYDRDLCRMFAHSFIDSQQNFEKIPVLLKTFADQLPENNVLFPITEPNQSHKKLVQLESVGKLRLFYAYILSMRSCMSQLSFVSGII